MALDSAANFVRQDVGSSVGTSDPETIDVSDASEFPDPSVSEYDIVIWDAGSHVNPDQDSDAEVLRVTGRDTGNNTLTVARGQQGTSNTSHPAESDVALVHLAEMDLKALDVESATTEKVDFSNISAGSTKILYEANLGSGQGTKRFEQVTSGVGQTATAILNLGVGTVSNRFHVMYVAGVQSGDNSVNFIDRVTLVAGFSTSDTELEANGTPDGRTYTYDGGDLDLEMGGSSDYNVIAYADGSRVDA